jgi:hypothetical protein
VADAPGSGIGMGPSNMAFSEQYRRTRARTAPAIEIRAEFSEALKSRADGIAFSAPKPFLQGVDLLQMRPDRRLLSFVEIRRVLGLQSRSDEYAKFVDRWGQIA